MTQPGIRTRLHAWVQKLSPSSLGTLEKDETASSFEDAKDASKLRMDQDSETKEQSQDLTLTETTSTPSSEFYSVCDLLVESCPPDTPKTSTESSPASSTGLNRRILHRTDSKGFNFLPISLEALGTDDRLPKMPSIEEATEEDSKRSISCPSRLMEDKVQGQRGNNDYFHVLQEFLSSNSSCKLKLLPERMREEPRMRYATNEKGEKVAIVFYNIGTFEENLHVFERLEASKQIPKLLAVIQPRKNYCFLVFECGMYSLAERMKRGNLNVIKKKSILLEILEALSSLHDQGIVHGNLNLFNIVYFAEDCSWKFLCLEVGVQSDDGKQIIRTPARENSSYTAPEILQAAARREPKICLRRSFDMWSYGMIASKLITGKRLYRSESSRRFPQIDMLLSVERCWKLKLICDVQGRNLVRRLLSPDPNSRPSATTALNDEFFRGLDISEEKDNAMRKILSLLASIHRRGKQTADVVLETRTETRVEHIKADISLEYFHRRSDPSDPFHLREGRKVFILRDRCLLDDKPAHLLKVGENYRLRVTLTNSQGLPLRVKNVDDIEASVSDSIPRHLPVHTEKADSGKHEVCALLELDELESNKLKTVGPWCGDLHQKYVALAIAITFSLQDRCPQSITEEIWCRMVSARCPLILPRLLRTCNKKWRWLPYEVRHGVRCGIKTGKFLACP